MLKQILSPKTCAECRLCCGFDCTDLWELPVLPAETVEALRRRDPAVTLTATGEEQTFTAPELRENEIYACPMLGASGCTMGDEKPFDCKIWPFRMMQDETGALRIAVASYCPGMEQYTEEQLRDFLSQGLAQQILDYAKAHPSHMKPFSAQYRMIW